MPNNKTGFTLLELLIAAALIGVLAMFATQAFRESASDIRIADAKSRALLVANAAQRYYLEYPGATSFNTGAENPLGTFSQPGTCQHTASPQALVNCGFLEYRQILAETKVDGSDTISSSIDMWFKQITPEVIVCFKGKGSRMLDKCTYCTFGEEVKKDSCPD